MKVEIGANYSADLIFKMYYVGNAYQKYSATRKDVVIKESEEQPHLKLYQLNLTFED